MNLRNESHNPPGCFWYLCPETKVRIPLHGTTSLLGCMRGLAEHYHANGYTVPGSSELRTRVIQWCCDHTEPGQCREDKRAIPTPATSWNMAVNRIAQGTKTLASWWLEGKENDEVAQRRAAICSLCTENLPIDKSTCSGCQAPRLNALVQYVAGILKASKPEPWEKPLLACRICGCDLRLKVRTKLDPIRRYMTQEQLAALPPTCWINTEPR